MTTARTRKNFDLAMNWKFEPGGRRYRNLCGCSLMAASDRDRRHLALLLRLLVRVPVEEDAGDPDVRGESGEDADEQHHGEALDRARAVLQEDPAGGGGGELTVEDGGERAREPEVDRTAHGFPAVQFVAYAFVDQDLPVDLHSDRQHDRGDAR